MEAKNKLLLRKTSLYHDKTYLEYHFSQLNKTAVKIAKENNVSIPTICKWIHTYNLREKPLYKDKKWLYHQYIILKKSNQEIAKICRANTSTIELYLVMFDIPIRTRMEAQRIRRMREGNNKNKLNNIRNSREQYKEYKNGLIALEKHNGFYNVL